MKFKIINRGYKQDLDINLIDIDENINVRTKIDKEGLKELEESIKSVGLIEPIVVSEDGERYKLIIGERRYYAYKNLKYKTIPARIIGPISQEVAQIISFSENLQRKELTTEELKKAARLLFNKYSGNKEEKIKKIAKDIGVKVHKVVEYLQKEAVPERVLTLVREGKLTGSKAWQITAYLLNDIKKLISLAEEMAKSQMTNPEKDAIIWATKKNPEASKEEIIKKSREPGIPVKIILIMDITQWTKISNQSQIAGYEKGEDLIHKLIEDYLENEGLL